jgi:hypothetical protein
MHQAIKPATPQDLRRAAAEYQEFLRTEGEAKEDASYWTATAVVEPVDIKPVSDNGAPRRGWGEN